MPLTFALSICLLVISETLNIPNTDVIFGLLLFSAVGYAFIYKVYRKNFVQILSSINDSNLANQLFRENGRLTNWTMALLVFFSTIILGVFVSWAAFNLNHLSSYSISNVLFGILGVALFVILRFTIFQLIGTISQRQQLFEHTVHHFWTIISFLGPILLLITAFSVFGPTGLQVVFSWIGLVAILLAYLIFVFKGTAICLPEKGIGPLNLIYYFCALEIMPVLLAYRTILS
ncbi:MAG: hypothetical protein ACI9FU_001240 [Granulosicoccus sp.]|jgi:hypothetical protein